MKIMLRSLMFRFYLPFQLGCTTEPSFLKNQFNLVFFKVRFPRKEKSKFNLFPLCSCSFQEEWDGGTYIIWIKPCTFGAKTFLLKGDACVITNIGKESKKEWLYVYV